MCLIVCVCVCQMKIIGCVCQLTDRDPSSKLQHIQSQLVSPVPTIFLSAVEASPLTLIHTQETRTHARTNTQTPTPTPTPTHLHPHTHTRTRTQGACQTFTCLQRKACQQRNRRGWEREADRIFAAPADPSGGLQWKRACEENTCVCMCACKDCS